LKKILLILLFTFSAQAFAQQNGYVNLKTKWIKVKTPVVQIDTFSIQPYYFEVLDVQNKLINKQEYEVNYVNATLFFKHFEKYKNRKLLLKFLVYPEFLHKTYQIIDKDKINRENDVVLVYSSESKRDKKPLQGLQTKGYISRGFNAGNNQSVVMQSALNLKIEGKLSDKTSIKAVLSDDNLPQAYSGISQTYKEFDRIYMQLFGENWQATGGDLLLKSKNTYFLKYLRKSQGLDLKIGKDSAQVQVTGALVNGQFAINKFNGVEGNQGPYLLKGTQGETYIFVIANTEKVFVNGKLLKKGIDADYVINYETAELRFNPTLPITQNQRIVVEFNYSVQHYLRYLNINKFLKKGKKLDFSIFTYLENDAKNKTLLFNIDKTQHDALQQAGDNLQELWITSAVETNYNENKILYKKVMAGTDEYFEYTTENIPDLYEVRFSYVGASQGSYKVKEIIAYGKIYEFVGEGHGSYEPKIRLTPAESKQYAGINFNYHPNDKTKIVYEGVASYFDKNLFSTLNDEDNLGLASHLDIYQSLWRNKNSNLSITFKHDFVHQNFNQLDAYLSPEFNREWQIDSVFGKQNLLDLGLVFNRKNNNLSAGIRKFLLRDTIAATQEFLQADWQYQKLKLLSDFRLTTQENNQQNKKQSQYLHQEIFYDYSRYNLHATAHYETRDAKQFNLPDTLNYRHKYAEMQWAKKDSTHFGFSLGYRLEQNDSIRWHNFYRVNKNHTVFSNLSWKKKLHKMELFLHFRHLNYYFTGKTRDLVNVKFLWQQYYYHKVVMTQVKVASFNGNTLRDEVVFVETPPGQGTHQWIDYNNNGIKEINEFELAVYSDQANYIRVVLPSKNYIATVNNDYGLHLMINPKAFSKNTFLQRLYLVSQFSTQHQSEQKNTFSPFVWQPDAPLYQNTVWQNDLFINRTRKKYFVHFTYQNLQQAQLLAVGKQSHTIEKIQLETKHALMSNLIWKQKIITTTNTNDSENYYAKNYRLKNNELQEQIDFLQTKSAKFNIAYQYNDKQNLSGNEKLSMNKLIASYFYQDINQNTFHASVNLVKNKMTGNLNSPVAFQMLEGLQVGNNLIITILYQQKITKYLEMNLQYNMRLSEDSPAIHTGGIALKMLF